MKPGSCVHVYRCDPAAQEGRARALAWSWLDVHERQRAERFVFDRDRVEYVVAHGLLREVLARRIGCAPSELRFGRSPTGKPKLLQPAAESSLYFNLSHSRGLVGCAVGVGRELGFDIEAIVEPAPLEIADHYFCRSELEGLKSLEPRQQHRRFYELWTLKEAYMKATGLGLGMPLHSFAVDPDAPRLLTATGSESWTLRSWSLSRHAMAIAVQDDGASLALECEHVARIGRDLG